MKKENAIFAIIAVIIIIAVIAFAVLKFLPTKTEKAGVEGYSSPSIFDITGFFTNSIKNTISTIQNIGTTTTNTTGTSTAGNGSLKPDTSEADQTASQILAGYLA